MISFLLAPDNVPFAAALVLMFGIGALEVVGAFFGAGLSSAIESVLPEVDMDAAVDAGGVESATPLSKLLGWFWIGKVPVLVLFVVLLAGFGIGGLAVQAVMASMTGGLLPWWLATMAAFPIGMGTVRVCGGVLGRMMPRDETEAVSEDSFVGRVAVVSSGVARSGSPAEARVTDAFRQTHYIMVVPDVEGDAFVAGDAVLVVRREGGLYFVIRNPNPALVD